MRRAAVGIPGWQAWGQSKTEAPTPRERLLPPNSPEAIIDVAQLNLLGAPPVGDAEVADEKSKPNLGLAEKRLRWIRESAQSPLPAEALAPVPTKFCVENACFGSYREVAGTLFGTYSGNGSVQRASSPTDWPNTLAVFCRPAKRGENGTTDAWSSTTARCFSDWGPTVGESLADSPEWACVGSPELHKAFVLPAGSEAGADKGFLCRRRVFRVLRPPSGAGEKGRTEAIKAMCKVMRRQTWPKIAQQEDAGAILDGTPGSAPKDAEQWPLTRDEILYFFGHDRFYCRADRPLTHRKENGVWADHFTCGVARGLLESGPFEEGVQVCATTPFTDRPYPELDAQGPPPRYEWMRDLLVPDAHRGRLHCWKFDRPTCEEISGGAVAKQLWKSDVFDAYDLLHELRRTGNRWAAAIPDAKEIAKLPSRAEPFVYADGTKDEGEGGVKEFCRLHGSERRVVCGYDLKSMARWYELRAHERPDGCEGGICARGAYRRGYLCGVFQSTEIRDGKPVWICGFDRETGGTRLAASQWVCGGGQWVSNYQSPTGERSSLRCSKRIFRWGETEASARRARGLDIIQRLRDRLTPQRMGQFETAPEIERILAAFGRGFLGVKRPDPAVRQSLHACVNELFGYLRGVPKADPVGFLGHRTTIRRFFAQEFKAQAYAPVRNLLEKSFQELLARKNKEEEGLRAIVGEVARGERAPDGRWFQEFSAEFLEGSGVKLGHSVALAAYSHHVLFQIFDEVAKSIQEEARRYADEVVGKARSGAPMTRLELLETAKRDPNNPWRVSDGDALRKVLSKADSTPVFCVTPASQTSPLQGKLTAPPENYLCGSSALLLAGIVEQHAHARRVPFLSPELFKKEYAGAWCYGATMGRKTRAPKKLSYVFRKESESPWIAELPRFDKGPNDAGDPGWLRCSKLQFADEVWRTADPERKKVEEKAQSPNPDAEVQKKVGGFGAEVLEWLIARLGNLQEIMRDLTDIKNDFIDGWLKRALEKLKQPWEIAKKRLNELREGIEKARKKVDDLRDAYEAAKENYLKNPTVKELLAKKQEAESAWKESKGLVQKATGAVDQGLSALKQQNRTVPDDQLVPDLLQAVQKLLADRLSRFVIPKAKALLSDGFRRLRGLLKPVEAAAVSAAAGAPFVGAVLAMGVTFAFDVGLSKLEDFVADKLVGFVERFLSGGLRSVLSPLMASLKKVIVEKVKAECVTRGFGDFCPDQLVAAAPGDAWIERATACRYAPVIGPAEMANAARAEARMQRRASKFRREAPRLARAFADQMLARYGYSYDSWLAATASTVHTARAALAAKRATTIERRLRAEIAARRAALAQR
jgi:hypothetical protein